MDDMQSSNLENEFRDIIKEAKEAETAFWSKIKRVTSHTQLMVYVYNGTAETFKLSAASWDANDALDKYTIEPWDYVSFALSDAVPYFARGRTSTEAKYSFSYESAQYAFDFFSILKLRKDYEAFSFSPKTIPRREQAVSSSGGAPLRCYSSITQSISTSPYHYGVVISLGGNH